ncbi:hypothetical protein CN378_20010 [Bacillus sp. AFS015802]|uniref:hypothetical protein n=1 Tax=Bacillus sp. AFS015802 TaxID=2033486 RepID=UPI000BF766EF|nr:hypothetical protein [Bacillus sp. AFS015802]PFA63377.1 hypothetical protein CN378_20010 [Bacillus sp. AFS015802]
MKKGWISIVGGFIVGLILSYRFLEYNGWIIYKMDNNGHVLSTVKEMDFNLITNSFLLMAASTLIIYLTLRLIETIWKRKSG